MNPQSITALLLAGASWHLTPDGWGPVKIGMGRGQVSHALHAKLSGDALDDPDSCIEMEAAGYPDVYFMFEDKRLARISLVEPSKVTTPRGIAVGASADEVRRAYGKALQAEPHYYEGLPSEYLTYWAVPKKRGVRFETNSKRQVQVIHAGTAAIQYVEGCA